MKHIKSIRFLVPLLLLLLIVPVAAQDIGCPVPPPCPADGVCPAIAPCNPPFQPGVFTNPAWLRIDHHRVSVTIDHQIATTDVDLEFVNEGNGMAEGTFVFPLPGGAAVDQLTMYINGVAIEAQILPADQARNVYNEIVRQYRDPALLEYVGDSAIQANVFPIPPGESRRIQIRYSQILEVENGLIHYLYPLKVTNLLTPRPVDSLSIHLDVSSNDPISNIYSPSHPIAISRNDAEKKFAAGYENSGIAPTDDFSLYYGVASQTINANLLTYRESATEDGFFMLLVQPPVSLPDDQRIAKDVIVVLDQSGSMQGEKWDQARQAAEYVLKHLNPRDRFNVVLFSTGERVFSTQMESPEQAQGAINWIFGQDADGGTDINGALTTAVGMTDAERPTTVLFLTDGLATEGETDSDTILANIKAAARSNVRIFTFGLGDDVDTFLLDAIAQDLRGAGSYVRPSERIDEEVAALYSKISAPVLTDITLDMGGLTADSLYPATPLPDLFAGTQLTLVGRYRGDAADLSFTLKGKVNGQEQTFVYSGLNFPARAGGEPFIARLWATRRIGDMLNTIRLSGENKELIDSVVHLSVRYGIITPYTSFLIQEKDVLSAQGLEEAQQQFAQAANTLSTESTGAGAVAAADAAASLGQANAPMAAPTITSGGYTVDKATGEIDADGRDAYINPIQTVGEKTFLLQSGVWMDTTFQSDTTQTQKVEFLSDAYFALLDAHPEIGQYLALGDKLIVVVEGVAYEVTSAA